eukprot:1191426-Prorocentrum_minimum.AAC.2
MGPISGISVIDDLLRDSYENSDKLDPSAERNRLVTRYTSNAPKRVSNTHSAYTLEYRVDGAPPVRPTGNDLARGPLVVNLEGPFAVGTHSVQVSNNPSRNTRSSRSPPLVTLHPGGG